jgi:hypothetical protein
MTLASRPCWVWSGHYGPLGAVISLLVYGRDRPDIVVTRHEHGRLNSNPDEPELPFSKCLIGLKSSDDGQLAVPVRG